MYRKRVAKENTSVANRATKAVLLPSTFDATASSTVHSWTNTI